MGRILTVPIFRDASDGVGYAVATGKSVHSAISMWTGTPGRLVPGYRVERVGGSITMKGNSDRGVATTWGTETNPSIIYKLRYGTGFTKINANAETTEGSAVGAVYGAAVHSYDLLDPPTSYWYVGAGTASHVSYRASDGTWATDGDVHAEYLRSIGGQLYRSLGPKISVCPAGEDPMDSSKWGDWTTVGSPKHSITGLTEAGGGVIVHKPEGLFRYDAANGVYVDLLLGSYRQAFDSKNGLGAATWMKYALHPMANGDLYATDGFQVYDWSPLANVPFSWDTTTRGRITAICPYGDGFFAALGIGHRRTQQGNIKVLFYDDSLATYTDITTNLIDGDPNTTATLAPDTGDILYVGADFPIRGIYVLMDDNPTGPCDYFSGEYSNGSGWTGIDYVLDETNGFTFEGVIACNDPILSHGSAPVTVNVSNTKYWIRLTFGSSAATDVLREISVIPWEPSIGISAGDDFTGLVASGLAPQIMYCRPEGNRARWHNVATLRLDTIRCMQLATNMKATVNNAGPKLAIIANYSRDFLLLGTQLDPSAEAFPITEDGSGYETGIPAVLFSPTDCGAPEYNKRLKRLFIDADWVDTSDRMEVFCRWDTGRWWKVHDGNTAPVMVNLPENGPTGAVLHVALSYYDGATESHCPLIKLVDAEVEVLEPIGLSARLDQQTVPLV